MHERVIETTVKEAQKMVHKDGWILFDTDGGHYQYKHPTKKGKVTIPYHSGDLPPGTLNNIKKQAGLKKKLK
jgi:predicted RNA binding protein YcfA (HicA-like mRNA interferase family)